MDFLSKFIRSKSQSPQSLKNDVDRKVHRNKIGEQQSPLKNQVNSLPSEEGKTSETTKENYNPKSLIEIAADKTKLAPLENSNSTSTPKIVKKESLKESAPSDFDLDYSIDIEPHYPRELFQGSKPDFSLSFLTDGLNKLGLDGSEIPVEIDVQSNKTFSDDEEQFVECQSFASIPAISHESINNLNFNQTISIRNEPSEGNDTITISSEAGNKTFEAETPKLNETETLTSTNDQTFDYIKSAVDATENVLRKMGESYVIESPIKSEAESTITSEVSQNSVIETEKVLLPPEENAEPLQRSMPETVATSEAETVTPVQQQEVVPSQEAATSDTGNITQDVTPSKDEETVEEQTSVQEVIPSPENSETQQTSPSHEQEVSVVEMMDISVVESEKGDTSVKEILPEEITELSKEESAVKIENLQDKESAGEQSTDELKATESSPAEIVKPVQEPISEMESSFRNIDEFVPHAAKEVSIEKQQEAPPTPEPTAPETKFDAAKLPSPSKSFENIFVEKMESSLEVQFKMPPAPVFKQGDSSLSDEEFKTCASSYNFNESDFDYLQTIGSNKQRWTLQQRDSILSRFDPLLAQHNDKRLTITKEEDDYIADFELKLPTKDTSHSDSREELVSSADNTFGSTSSVIERSPGQVLLKEDDMGSVDIMKDISVENKISESNHIDGEEAKLSSHHNEENGLKMAELENKIKKEAEMREEALLKRISEKDKQIAKMNGVVEAYEKAISELIAEKEQLVQSYEKKCSDLKNNSELNANHLESLEATFSDLHAKYERTKQIAMELKEREENIVQERKTLTESLKMQEARYDKMKAHAMSQLEIANNTLADINRNHQAEVTKLKAQLKKEEISRASVNEQLIQKSKENSELVKICDELINGTQSS